MALHSISLQAKLPSKKSVQRSYQKLLLILEYLEGKTIPEKAEVQLNERIDKINAETDSKKLGITVRKAYQRATQLLEQHMKIVPRRYYVMQWMAIGIAAFGVPIGVALGTALGNMAFMGAGIGMGLPIGMAVGTSMDQKAEKEGRQLPFDV